MGQLRSLYQCYNAKCGIDEIFCSKGHEFGKSNCNVSSLKRGDPLEYTVCQECTDFEFMGPPIPKEERGWMDIEAITGLSSSGRRESSLLVGVGR